MRSVETRETGGDHRDLVDHRDWGRRVETRETEGDHRDWRRPERLGETIETGGDHRDWGTT